MEELEGGREGKEKGRKIMKGREGKKERRSEGRREVSMERWMERRREGMARQIRFQGILLVSNNAYFY